MNDNYSSLVLPGTHTIQPQGVDSLVFTVFADGTIDYDPSLDFYLGGRGPRTLRLYVV